jgi:hypothetical protein
MFYAELNDGQRTMIETDAVFLADRSEAVGADKRIVHALRLKKGSELLSGEKAEELKSKGYEQCTAAQWFEFSTANMTGEEANLFAENAANS